MTSGAMIFTSIDRSSIAYYFKATLNTLCSGQLNYNSLQYKFINFVRCNSNDKLDKSCGSLTIAKVKPTAYLCNCILHCKTFTNRIQPPGLQLIDTLRTKDKLNLNMWMDWKCIRCSMFPGKYWHWINVEAHVNHFSNDWHHLNFRLNRWTLCVIDFDRISPYGRLKKVL